MLENKPNLMTIYNNFFVCLNAAIEAEIKEDKQESEPTTYQGLTTTKYYIEIPNQLIVHSKHIYR